MKILNAEEQQEYLRLYGAFRTAVNLPGEMFGRYGMDSEHFHKADAAAGKLSVQLRNLLGVTAHWG